MPIINQIVKGGGTTPTGTLPITNNGTYDVTNYATADVNVPVNAVPDYYVKKKILADGRLAIDDTQTTLSTNPATGVANNGMANVLNGSKLGVAVDCSSLTSIGGQNAFSSAFRNATISSFDFSNVATITGSDAFAYAFADYKSSTYPNSIFFPALTSISGATAFQYAWSSDNKVATVSMPLLTNISSMAFYYAFSWASAITTLTLGGTAAMTIGNMAFEGMFDGCSQNITVNAPLANKSDIEAMSGYPSFGAYGTVTWNWVS